MNDKKAKRLRKLAKTMTTIQGRFYDAKEYRKSLPDGTIEVTRSAVNNPRTERGIYRKLKKEF